MAYIDPCWENYLRMSESTSTSGTKTYLRLLGYVARYWFPFLIAVFGLLLHSLAEIAFIDASDAGETGLSAIRLALKRRMQTLERSVLLLRGRKADYLEDDYWTQLETLLIDLAKTTEEFTREASE